MDVKLPELKTQGNKSLIDHFMNVLGNFNTVIPNSDLFIVNFERIPPEVSDQFFGKLGETSQGYNIGIDKGISVFNQLQGTGGFGFSLCIGVNTPEEGQSITQLQTQGALANGYLPIPVNNERKYEQTGLTTEILETNISLIDLIFRPWIVQYNRTGGITDNRFYTNITVYQLSRDVQRTKVFNLFGGTKPLIRKVYTFYDCAPIQLLQTDTFKYTGEELRIVTVPIQWKYSRYDVRLLQ